jgi:hypothetical protein
MRLLLRIPYWDARAQVWLQAGDTIEIDAVDLARYHHHGAPIEDTADDHAKGKKPAAAATKK